MDSAFKVSISWQNSRSYKIMFNDGILNLLGDFSGISDTSHAAITSGGEANLI